MHDITVVNVIDANVLPCYIYIEETMNDVKNMPSIIIRDIDEELRKRLRIICLEKGISMNQQLKQLVKDFVTRELAKQKKE